MDRSTDTEQIYAELRRRAVVEYGESRAAELEDFLRTTAGQIADVESADIDRDVEPLNQE